MHSRLPILVASLFIGSIACTIAVQPNSLFTDNAVFQQNVPIPVWGTGDAGESVSVEFNGQTASTTVKEGTWRVNLPAMPAGGPFTLTIKGNNTVTASNILVGEVWICSGQSNMERQLGPRPPQQPLDNWEQEVANANFPQFRMYIVPHASSKTPVTDAKGSWLVCSPKTAAQFSAVGYFFGSTLHQKLKLPVGMLFTSVGGTPVEAWTSEEMLKSLPAGVASEQKFEKAVADFPAKQQAAEQKYQQDVADAQKNGKPAPPKPSVRDPAQGYLSRHFNAMVVPLIPFPIHGVIWYQGESNGGNGLGYRSLFPGMIKDWRDRWGMGNFPFLFVQLASFRSNDPMIREAQLLTLHSSPNTAMVVTSDIGDPADIHPPHKRPVGERLALAAEALAYGSKDEYSGAIYDSFAVQGSKVVIHFTHAGGLNAKGGALTGFMIAGADKKFVPADATIDGDTVVVSSAAVAQPTAVHYQFIQITTGNLYNGAGLPASPFRTDVDPDPTTY